MKRIELLNLLVLVLLVAAPATAQKANVDYDRSVDFNAYKTFAWGPTPETSLQEESPLMHSRIKGRSPWSSAPWSARLRPPEVCG